MITSIDNFFLRKPIDPVLASQIRAIVDRAWEDNMVKPGHVPCGYVRPFARQSYSSFVGDYAREYFKRYGNLPFGRHWVTTEARSDVVVFRFNVISSDKITNVPAQKT